MVVAMASCQAIVLFDLTAFGVALPAMQRALELSPTGVSWAVNAYVVAFGAFVALGGRLSDRLSHLKVFVAGVAVFLSASVACGLTPGTGEEAAAWLIVFRSLQGVGGALMMPSALAVVLASVPANARGRGMAIFVGGGQIFFILGPILGGAITQGLSWRWIFFVVVLLGAAAMGLILIARARGASGADDGEKEAEAGRAAGRPAGRIFRWTALPLICGTALLVLGLERADTWGFFSPLTLGSVALALALLALLVVREWNAEDPLVELDLLTRPGLPRLIAIQFLMQLVSIGVLVFAPVYFQRHLGLSPSDAGLVMLAFVGGWVLTVPPAGLLYDRFGTDRLVAVGSILIVAGLALWTWRVAETGAAAIWWQAPAMFLTGAGVGLALLSAYTASIAAARPGRVAASAGLVQTVRQGGGAVAVALLSTPFLGQASGSATSVDGYRSGFLMMLAAMTVAMFLGIAALWPRRRTAGAP